jgi:hypothetical protein
MKGYRGATLSFLVGAAVLGSTALVEAGPRAVVELFTSQGCSSCPAADRVLGELSKDPSLVTLSLPIDYWDYLGWKDTLAKPRHTARQRAYSISRGDRQVYTPQVVVNGSIQVLGSDKASIERAVAQSDSAAVLPLPLSLRLANGRLMLTAGAQEGAAEAEVWLCGVSKSVPVTIERGENRGKTLTYYNVVRRWVKLGTWTGSAQTWTLPVADIKRDDVDEVAAFVQSGSSEKPGAILGAVSVSLR